MHRLVQLITKKWLADKGKDVWTIFASHALSTVSSTFPFRSWSHGTTHTCIRYLLHANAVLSSEGSGSDEETTARGSLLESVGGYFICKHDLARQRYITTKQWNWQIKSLARTTLLRHATKKLWYLYITANNDGMKPRDCSCWS
jgi:hypothetical protein